MVISIFIIYLFACHQLTHIRYKPISTFRCLPASIEPGPRTSPQTTSRITLPCPPASRRVCQQPIDCSNVAVLTAPPLRKIRRTGHQMSGQRRWIHECAGTKKQHACPLLEGLILSWPIRRLPVSCFP